jgi:hypothetical protein
MEISTANLGDFVKSGQILWTRGADSIEQAMMSSGIVKIQDIPENTGNSREFSEIDSNEYAKRKGEGDQAKRGKVQQGYSKTMYSSRIGENIGITYEMRTQNKYPEIVSRLTNLGRVCAQRMDLDLAHRFSFGTATSYTNMDSEIVTTTTGETTSTALFDTTHDLKGSTTTYRNILANNPRLSKGSLEAMEKLAVEQTYNNLGESMISNPTIIFTTADPNTINTVKEYLTSTASPDGINSGVMNVYKGKYRHVILPRMATTAFGVIDTTKVYYWGLIDPNLFSFYIGIWERPRLLASGLITEDNQTDDWEFRTRASYGIVTVSARGSWMSKGDASA